MSSITQLFETPLLSGTCLDQKPSRSLEPHRRCMRCLSACTEYDLSGCASESFCQEMPALAQQMSTCPGKPDCMTVVTFGCMVRGAKSCLQQNVALAEPDKWGAHLQGFGMGGQGYGGPSPMGGPMGGGMGGMGGGFQAYQPPSVGPGAPGYMNGSRQSNLNGITPPPPPPPPRLHPLTGLRGS